MRLRRPAIAGLPLLVLFCVPLTTISNPGWASNVIVFSLGIAGYLALLSADGRERVRLWGRLVRTWPGQSEARGPDTRQLTAAGRRVGFATVVLALCVPLVLPAFARHRLFHGSRRPGGPGGYTGSLSLPNPLLQMNDAAAHDLTRKRSSPTTPAPPLRPTSRSTSLAGWAPATGAWRRQWPPPRSAAARSPPCPASPPPRPALTIHERSPSAPP